MKRFIPVSVMAVAVLVALTTVSPNRANGQSAGLVSSVLSRMEKNRKDLRTMRASISMEKYNSQLRDSDNFQGIVLYVPGSGRQGSVRIDWSKPRREIMSVSNGKYTIYRPNLKVVYTGNSNSKANKAGGILEMMYMTRQQLEARFQPVQDVREETLWGGVSTIHLTLVPKGNSSFKYAEIWIDMGGMPVQTKVVEKNDDSTTMRLTGVERNIKVNSDEFNIKLDADVKVVKS
ncbi:MAG TPA: outer membrane lipoprotein carrier protein LolA [Pyrinomonadaceae bacterium]